MTSGGTESLLMACKTYRDFAAEFARLQDERIAAYSEFKADVDEGIYPGPEHLVGIADAEFQSFLTSSLTTAPNVASVKTSLTIRTSKHLPGVPVSGV